MKQINELFSNMATLAQHAPAVDTNLSLGDLKAAFGSSWKQLTALVTDDVLDAIADGNDENLKQALRTALANRTLANHAIFSAYHQRLAGTDVYKYEVEQMQRAYMENYFSAMDTLLTELTSLAVADNGTEEPAPADSGTTPDIGHLFRQCRWYKMASTVRIKTAEQFDMIYPIDLSYLFFFRTLPLQKEVASGRIGSYYGRIDALERDDKDAILSMADMALVKKTVAKALRRFDILEFPPTIRNLFDESHANRNGKDESERAISLADMLDGEADALISDLDTLLESENGLDVSSTSAYNLPDDKIIMMP